MGFIDTILRPIEWVVAWIMVAWHSMFDAIGLPAEAGITWALSVVGLVIVIRILLIPLFVKQIKASRSMQLLQPEMRKIQDKYKGKTDPASRQAMTQETMALYRDRGTNPFSSCLPILAQSPIFFALFRVLNGINGIAEGTKPAIGPLDQDLAKQADAATIFGAPLSDTFLGADNVATQVVTVILIILMSATTYTTQRQLMMKNMPASAMDNPFFRQQKIMLYLFPVIFAVSGVNFPIGVLLYWLTTNLWSMGQQFYVIRRMPAPGSPAEKALEERRRRHGKGGAGPAGAVQGASSGAAAAASDAAQPAPSSPQRQQPKRQPRSKRSGARGSTRPKPTRQSMPPAGGATGGGRSGDEPEGERRKTGR